MKQYSKTLNLMSIRAAAIATGVPYRRLLGAVHDGTIRSVKLSKHPLISERALSEYIVRSVGESA